MFRTFLMSNYIRSKCNGLQNNVAGIFYASALTIHGSVPPSNFVMELESLEKAKACFYVIRQRERLDRSFLAENQNQKQMSNHITKQDLIGFIKTINQNGLNPKSFEDYSPLEIKDAFITYNNGERPFSELLELCDSLFELLDRQELLPDYLRKIIWQLFKSYSIYKALLQKEEGCEV